MADEPRSLVVPPDKPGAAQNVGIAIPQIPGRLRGGKAIRVTADGPSFTVDLDISKLAPADPGILAQQWFAMWREGDAPSDIFRVPMTVIPSLPLPMNQVSGLVEALTAIDGDLDGLDTRLDAIEPVVASHTVTLADHENRLNVIEPVVATHTGQIATINGQLVTIDGKLADGGKGDITVSASFATWTIDNNVVTDAKLRDSAALSVIGRSANSAGDPADITAGTDGFVLFRSGTALIFGQLVTASLGDNIVTDAKLRDSAALSVIGRSANSTGDPADITAGTDGFVLRRSGTSLGFGTVATAGIANDAVDNTKLANMANATFKGRTTAGTGDPEDLTATQATALLNVVVGDSGSGGTKGLAPAPGAGDAAAGKYLSAAGNYSVPTVTFPSGAIVDSAYAEYTANADLASIPYDDTPPQNTEGTQVLSLSFTPKSATNKLRIRFKGWGSNSGGSVVAIAALFIGTGVNAVQAVAATVNGGAGVVGDLAFEYEYTPGSTSAVTIAVRAGASSGTLRLNGGGAARIFGGASRATLVIEEIKA